MANLIRISVVAQKLGNVHESCAWKKLAGDPAAPKSIKLSGRLTVFDEGEVDRWIARMVKAAKSKPAKAMPRSKKSDVAIVA